MKKAVAKLALSLIFVLPIFMSMLWVYQVFGGTEPRKTYSQAQIEDFRKSACTGDDVSQTKPFDEPLITVTFDDGWETIYSQGFEAMESRCIKSTQYILGDHYHDQLYLSKKQVHSMQDAGHEIASHTMSHPNLTTLSEGTIEWELGEADRLLSAEFGEIREFATPLGASNDMVLEYIKKYYRSHRNARAPDLKEVGDININIPETFDIYNINAFTVRSTTATDDLRRLIDYTKKRKGWLILTYHQVQDDSDSNYAVSKKTLEEHLDLIKASGVRTPTMGQVLDAIEGSRK